MCNEEFKNKDGWEPKLPNQKSAKKGIGDFSFWCLLLFKYFFKIKNTYLYLYLKNFYLVSIIVFQFYNFFLNYNTYLNNITACLNLTVLGVTVF